MEKYEEKKTILNPLFYVKYFGIWVICTKTDMDLNMMFTHTANYWAFILNCQSHMLYLNVK